MARGAHLACDVGGGSGGPDPHIHIRNLCGTMAAPIVADMARMRFMLRYPQSPNLTSRCVFGEILQYFVIPMANYYKIWIY
jgi:hypothetical protein